MKITEIRTFICHSYRTNWVFVKVMTDGGVHGVGEATLEMRELTVAEAIRELKRYLIGKDPRNTEAVWHDCYRDAYWRGGVVLMSALAAIDMALWDIKGKDLGVPVYQLLGGKVNESVPCYANGWFASANTPAEFAAKAKEVAKKGFKGIKWDPFGASYMNLSKQEFKNVLDCIGAVVAAVGNKIDIMIEGHGRFNVPTAIKICHALEDFDITWFEEPIPPDHMEGLAQIRKKTNIPLAAGERLYSRWDYRDFLKRECADFVQPDVSHAGGISEIKKIAAMAECFYIPVCPHNPSGPVANAATLHVAASTPNFYFLETMSNDVPYRSEISTEEVVLEEGMMYINDRPGLGIDIQEEAVTQYAYQPRDLKHYNGRLTEIRPDNARGYFAK